MAFVVGFPGLHKTTKKSAAEPRYMTFEAQTFLLNKDTVHDYALLRLEDVARGTAAVSHLILLILKLYFGAKTPVLLRLEDVARGTAAVSHLILLILKLYFGAKTPVLTPFLYRSIDQPIFFNVVEVSECFWTVPGQSGAELPIFICPS